MWFRGWNAWSLVGMLLSLKNTNTYRGTHGSKSFLFFLWCNATYEGLGKMCFLSLKNNIVLYVTHSWFRVSRASTLQWMCDIRNIIMSYILFRFLISINVFICIHRKTKKIFILDNMMTLNSFEVEIEKGFQRYLVTFYSVYEFPYLRKCSSSCVHTLLQSHIQIMVEPFQRYKNKVVLCLFI